MSQSLHDGKYSYGYSAEGIFTLLDKKGEPLYPKGLPLLKKVYGHLLYSSLWIVLIALTRSPLLMSLLIATLFLLGCRLTQLLMIHPLRPLFFPPLWMRITKELTRNPSLSVLEKHGLAAHPGLLKNLELAQAMHKNDLNIMK